MSRICGFRFCFIKQRNIHISVSSKKSLQGFSLVFTYFSGKFSMLHIFLWNFKFCVEQDFPSRDFGRFIWNFRFHLFIGRFVDHLYCSYVALILDPFIFLMRGVSTHKVWHSLHVFGNLFMLLMFFQITWTQSIVLFFLTLHFTAGRDH